MTDHTNKPYLQFSFFKKVVPVVIGILFLAALADLFTSLPIWKYTLGFVLIGLMLLLFRISQLIYQRIMERRYDYWQTEALISLYHHLDPQVELPQTRGWAAGPDFLNVLLAEVRKHKPKVIVEASCGISTIILSEYLRKEAPETRHYALEHSPKYAQLCREKVFNPNSQVIQMPLKTYTLEEGEWQWYDFAALPKDLSIDLLVVDGPPVRLQRLPRFPAVPLLLDRLSEHSSVLLDDGIREDEKEIANQWAAKYGYELNYLDLEKGGFLLTKNPL